jgi:uncharacterized repeat protein (TIGR01451 family)
MSKFYPLKVLLISLLFWGIGAGVQAQNMTLTKTVYNYTTGGDGSTASQGDVLLYTITVTNTSSKSFTSTILYDNIPTGTTYKTGTTKLNGTLVSDVSGAMPYASGGSIKSSGSSTGVIGSGKTATIEFKVTVTANAGTIRNYATVDGTYNGVSYVNQTNTVFTNLIKDPMCNTMFQSTPTSTLANSSSAYTVIRDFDTLTGKAVNNIYFGASGPCKNAITGADTTAGSLLNATTAAIAYDKSTKRIYFVINNSSQPPLSYIDLNGTPTAYYYPGYPLETSSCGSCNVNRMCFASDGYGYALTSNANDLIKFYVDPSTNLPVINRLGALINDAANQSYDIGTEQGGDIYGDGNGRIYLIANSSRIYKINTSTRVATYMGSATPSPGTSQSIAISPGGNVFIGGAYQNVYKIDLETMNVTSVVSSTSNVYWSADYTSCAFPVLAANIIANKSYKNINGSSTVVGGDTVVYTITITNTGNFNASNVKLYDYIPASTHYIPNTTTLNGGSKPDVGGVMPYAVTGGAYVNSPGEIDGIVKAGVANSATVTFNVVTDPLKTICNQSKITLIDGDGNLIFVNSSNPDSTGQTPTCFFSDELLPIDGLKFKGSLVNGQSVLNWTQLQDDNVAYYEIEYSETGSSFTSIGRVTGKGNTGTTNSYQYTDQLNNLSATRFYRLKIVQTGGTVNYSSIIRLDVKALNMTVVPNPFDKSLNLQVQLQAKETVNIRLLDFSGREVYSTMELLPAGNHSLSLVMPPSLAKGMYVLDVSAGGTHMFQKKLVKQ